MCLCYTERDRYQMGATGYRIKAYIRMHPFGLIIKVLGAPIFLLLVLSLLVVTYDSHYLALDSTNPTQYFVTSSTPNAADNFFVDEQSGFSSNLTF